MKRLCGLRTREIGWHGGQDEVPLGLGAAQAPAVAAVVLPAQAETGVGRVHLAQRVFQEIDAQASGQTQGQCLIPVVRVAQIESEEPAFNGEQVVTGDGSGRGFGGYSRDGLEPSQCESPGRRILKKVAWLDPQALLAQFCNQLQHQDRVPAQAEEVVVWTCNGQPQSPCPLRAKFLEEGVSVDGKVSADGRQAMASAKLCARLSAQRCRPPEAGQFRRALERIGGQALPPGLNIRQHQCGLCGVEDRFAELELESGPAAIGRVQVDTDREVVFRAAVVGRVHTERQAGNSVQGRQLSLQYKQHPGLRRFHRDRPCLAPQGVNSLPTQAGMGQVLPNASGYR